MAKPYSEDLRSRVMQAYDSGEKQSVVAKRFNISEKTIYLWRLQRKERGNIRAITKYQKGHSHKILDLDKFKEFALNNNHMTTIEMAKSWGNVCKSTISNKLKLIKFTKKKDIWLSKPK